MLFAPEVEKNFVGHINRGDLMSTSDENCLLVEEINIVLSASGRKDTGLSASRREGSRIVC